MKSRIVTLMTESLYIVWMLFTIGCATQSFVGIINGNSPYGVAVFFAALGGCFVGFLVTRWAYRRRMRIVDEVYKKIGDAAQKRIVETRKRIEPLQKKAVESFGEFMTQVGAGNPEGAQAAANNVTRLNELIEAVVSEQLYIDQDDKEEKK